MLPHKNLACDLYFLQARIFMNGRVHYNYSNLWSNNLWLVYMWLSGITFHITASCFTLASCFTFTISNWPYFVAGHSTAMLLPRWFESVSQTVAVCNWGKHWEPSNTSGQSNYIATCLLEKSFYIFILCTQTAFLWTHLNFLNIF